MFVEQYEKKACPVNLNFSEQGVGQNTLVNFPWRGGAEYFRANNININVDIMFVEQYGKKTCPVDLHFSSKAGGRIL